MIANHPRRVQAYHRTTSTAARRHVLVTVVVSFSCILVISDIKRLFNGGKFTEQSPSAGSAWASWIGEVPTAAELYGDAASDMPTTEAFDDDDEDEELDASASNEYPDNDESYDDPEGKYRAIS